MLCFEPFVHSFLQVCVEDIGRKELDGCCSEGSLPPYFCNCLTKIPKIKSITYNETINAVKNISISPSDHLSSCCCFPYFIIKRLFTIGPHRRLRSLCEHPASSFKFAYKAWIPVISCVFGCCKLFLLLYITVLIQAHIPLHFRQTGVVSIDCIPSYYRIRRVGTRRQLSIQSVDIQIYIIHVQ